MSFRRVYYVSAVAAILICCITPILFIDLGISTAGNDVLTSFPEVERNESSESESIPNNDNNEHYDGKVIEAFLSPYTAKENFRNIYLNNRTESDINLEEIYNLPPNLSFKKNGEVEVLILHTHATEGYLPKDMANYSQEDIDQTEEESRSVIAVGEIIRKKLSDYGIVAIHDKTLHDNPSYQESYNRAAETTKKYLEEYPTIKIVIDIHRDSVSSNGGLIKGVSQQNGKDAAQIMFVAGSQTGKVSGFDKWQENLKLVLRLQEMAETLYPGLARAIYFTSKKYNQHLSTGSILIEVGTSVNSIEEAKYSAELLGDILGITFNLFAEE